MRANVAGSLDCILGKRLTEFQGLISGIPVRSSRIAQEEKFSGDPTIKDRT